MSTAEKRVFQLNRSKVMIIAFCVMICLVALVSPLLYYVYLNIDQRNAIERLNEISTRGDSLYERQPFYENYEHEFFKNFVDVVELRVNLSDAKTIDRQLFRKVLSAKMLRIDCDVPDDMNLVQDLLEVDGVETLVVSGEHLEQRHLDLIRQLPGLKTLAISCKVLTDDFVNSLIEMQQLEVLSLSNCPLLSNAIFKPLSRMPSLRHLKLLCSRLTCDGVELLTSLESLYLLNCPLREDIFIAVAQLKWMRSLSIASCPVSGSTAALSDLAYLAELSVLTKGLTYSDVSWVLESTKIKYLNIEHIELSKEQALALTQIPQLRRLHLSGLPDGAVKKELAHNAGLIIHGIE